MHRLHRYAVLAARAADETATTITVCEGDEAGTSHWGLRIASIFVILAGSALGAILPVWLARTSRLNVPKGCFFVAKYFGSGVILATAWMHLLSPASDNLRDPCIEHIMGEYDWAMCIGLMTVMTMFLIEIVVSQFDWGFGAAHDHGHGHEHEHKKPTGASATEPPSALGILAQNSRVQDLESGSTVSSTKSSNIGASSGPFDEDHRHQVAPELRADFSGVPGGEEHLAHQRDHTEGDAHANFAAQMTALFILEFGVIFHSIFIGLTLAVTNNFIILFIVLVFHQTFEGLGLGARLATATWPSDGRRWTPYFLACLYAVSTPFAIGIGLIVNKSMMLDAATSKIVNGVFDAISGGILMYTGLVELLAHEFMFNPEMRKAGLNMQLRAYACVAVGVALMALLAKWA
ncbi:Zinc/iron permease [Apodospora peruviana]|uniref:Zinc/iron permease n=1 Tax=Apodospora peruviana TaxID=516989 RepID=A0AAE0HVM3_9PEZI|nr:Zinc/iron permease [Apodospora peruviana]